MASRDTARLRPGSDRAPRVGRGTIIRWFFLTLAAAVPAAPLAAQAGSAAKGPASPATASQAKAARVLAAGMEAMGGRRALEDLVAVTQVAQVTRWTLGQEPTPVGEGPVGGRNLLRVTALPEDEARVIEFLAAPDAVESAARIVLRPDGSFMYNAAQKSIQEIDDPDALPWNWIREYVTFAPLVLKDALDRSRTLRYLGQDAIDGEPVEVITYADANGNQKTLCFAEATGLLVRVEQVADHAQFGQVPQRLAFGDYRPVEGMSVPFEVRMTVGDRRLSESVVSTVTFRPASDPAILARPEGATVTPGAIPSGPDAEMRTEEIAPGIFQVLHIKPGYNLTYVDQGDAIVAIEPLGGPEASEMMLKRFRTDFPGKPVAAVVVTHHHHDHTDGLVPYLQKGIPVYATPGNGAFIRGIASAPRHPKPDPAIPAPDIRVVDGRTVVGTGPNRFELYDVGPNPHAEEILVAYFPEHRMLYVPDVYGYVPGFTPPPLLLSFAEKLEELGLQVDRFATAHTEPETWAAYKAMVDAVRAAGGG